MRILGAPGSDLILAVALAVFAAMDTLFTRGFGWLDEWRGPRAVNGIVMPVAALLLAWRRRYPLAVLAGVMLAIDSLGYLYGSTQASTSVFIIAIAVYSAAAYGSSVLAGVTITAVGVWIRDAYDPLLTSAGERIWDWIFVGIFYGVGYGTRLRRRHLEGVKAQAREAERNSASQIAAAAEAERQRIARELHDIVSHSLGLLVFQAGVGEQFVDTEPEKARDAFRSIRVAGAEAVSEMGTILGLIRGERAAGREPQPRAADIELLVAKARASGVDVDLVVDGEVRALPAAVELSMYRIAQEGLTNAFRHAPNAPVQVEVHYGAQNVRVVILNSSAGLQTPVRSGPDRPIGGGRGLIGLAERMSIFDGQLEVGPTIQGGWSLSATLPAVR